MNNFSMDKTSMNTFFSSARNGPLQRLQRGRCPGMQQPRHFVFARPRRDQGRSPGSGQRSLIKNALEKLNAMKGWRVLIMLPPNWANADTIIEGLPWVYNEFFGANLMVTY